MLNQLNEFFAFYQNALELRSQRRGVLASNIANADTPGYKARDFSFSTALERAVKQGGVRTRGLELATTAPRHVHGNGPTVNTAVDLKYRVPDQPSLDGNTVNMDVERVNFLANASHYQADLRFVTGRIKNLKLAMQPSR